MKGTDRVKKFAEVFTPSWLVNDMLDMLEKENTDKNIYEGTFLEPACGNGNFLVQIASRKLKAGLSTLETANTIYGVDILPDNVDECINRLLDILPGTRDILEKHVVKGNFLTKTCLDGTPIWFLEE